MAASHGKLLLQPEHRPDGSKALRDGGTDARAEVFGYVEHFYNPRVRDSVLDCLSQLLVQEKMLAVEPPGASTRMGRPTSDLPSVGDITWPGAPHWGIGIEVGGC